MPTWMYLTAPLTGVAVAAAAYWLTALSGVGIDPPGGEASRRRALRQQSRTYRWFEPTVRALAGVNARNSPLGVAKLGKALELLGVEHWRADELTAVKQVEGVAVAAAVGVLGGALFGPAAGVMLGVLAVAGVPYLLLADYRQRADLHVRRVRSRLPHAMDLMALMLEAGAGTLRECLERVGLEHPHEPLGDEFRRTLAGVEQGVGAADMLRSLDKRIADPDVTDLVLTVTTAEERGIALKDALRGLADRMRQRRVQWMEKSAEQAKVKITGPVMVTMLGCLLIVVAPLLLNAFVTTGK